MIIHREPNRLAVDQQLPSGLDGAFPGVVVSTRRFQRPLVGSSFEAFQVSSSRLRHIAHGRLDLLALPAQRPPDGPAQLVLDRLDLQSGIDHLRLHTVEVRIGDVRVLHELCPPFPRTAPGFGGERGRRSRRRRCGEGRNHPSRVAPWIEPKQRTRWW